MNDPSQLLGGVIHIFVLVWVCSFLGYGRVVLLLWFDGDLDLVTTVQVHKAFALVCGNIHGLE